MTRFQYLEALAEAAEIINAFEDDPMTFAACPGKVSRAMRKWQSATDEERAEAAPLVNPPSGAPGVGC